MHFPPRVLRCFRSNRKRLENVLYYSIRPPSSCFCRCLAVYILPISRCRSADDWSCIIRVCVYFYLPPFLPDKHNIIICVAKVNTGKMPTNDILYERILPISLNTVIDVIKKKKKNNYIKEKMTNYR